MREAPEDRSFVVDRTDKPSSVSRRGRPRHDGDHSSRTPVAGTSHQRPTQGHRAGSPSAPCGASPLYAVLLRVGFAMPLALPSARWALTPPFHPYGPRRARGLFSVALSSRFPSPGVTRHPALWSSDFPPAFRPAITWVSATARSVVPIGPATTDLLSFAEWSGPGASFFSCSGVCDGVCAVS